MSADMPDSASVTTEKSCHWHLDGDADSSEAWDTECGDRFILNEGTPADNKMAYCCYCGGKLK